jgi:hypothetical protein
MLILKRIIGKKNTFFFVIPGKTETSSDERGMSSKMKKIEYQTRRVRSCFNRVIELNRQMLILKRFVTKIKQYLSTDNFSVNNRHVVIKSSQET